jgi:hypothetical protein
MLSVVILSVAAPLTLQQNSNLICNLIVTKRTP